MIRLVYFIGSLINKNVSLKEILINFLTGLLFFSVFGVTLFLSFGFLHLVFGK